MTQVQLVLQECERNLRNRYGLPRPMRQVLIDLGVELVEMPQAELRAKFESFAALSPAARATLDSKGIAGFFVSGKSSRIFLESGLDSSARVRFTAAHELAHHLVHDITGVIPGEDYWDHEVACNWFAGTFLAPSDAVNVMAGPRGREWINRLQIMADEFKVSIPVIAGALTDATSGRIVFIRLKESSRQGRECYVVSDSSTRRYLGKALGVGAKATLAELGLNGIPTLNAMDGVPQINLGSLGVKGCPALFRRHGSQIWGMVKLPC